MSLAVGLHLLILIGLGLTVARLDMRTRGEEAANAMSVTMVRLPPLAGRPDAAPLGKVRLRTEPLPVNPLPPVPMAPTPSTPAPEGLVTKPDAEALQKTLRGLVGCAESAGYRLSAQEQAHCDRRSGAPAPVAVQIDARAQAAFEADSTRQEALVVRKPVNGCLPRAGNRPSAIAQAGRGASMAAQTTGGVGCAWSF